VTAAHSAKASVDRIDAVVVAAGSSSRMGGRDKLAADLRGRSVLRWSVEALAAAGVGRIVIATSPARLAETAALEWLPYEVVSVVAGGERRQESVAAGVAALAEFDREAAIPNAAPDPVILVHDAARPLASPSLIRAVAQAVAKHGAAIPVMPVTETLKRLSGDVIGTTVDRSDVVAANAGRDSIAIPSMNRSGGPIGSRGQQRGVWRRANNAHAGASYCTHIVTPLWLIAVPTRTRIGTAPEPASAGTTAFTCKTPATAPGLRRQSATALAGRRPVP